MTDEEWELTADLVAPYWKPGGMGAQPPGEISPHLAEVCGTDVSHETISKVTDADGAEMAEWLVRPLDAVYPVVFIDAIHVKVRDCQVANRPPTARLA